MRQLSAVLLLLCLTPAIAESASCIEHPKRVKACPHIIYRSAQLPDMPKPALICICVSDFDDLLKPAASDSEKVQQNMARRQLEVTFGKNLPAIMAILERRD